MLKVGTKAPDFTLPGSNGDLVTLSSFLGKRVVIYFYSKDNTSGCTKQALGFKENFEEYYTKGYVVIGISKDSVASHQKFSDKYGLPFILLSDTELNVLKQYEVWAEKMMYGKPYMGVVRTTYVIDENGYILKVFEKVKPDTNAKEVLCKL